MPLLAVLTQRRIALMVVLLLVLGWVIYLISTGRRTYEPGSEVEVAPNRKPYYDDDGMEGPRLTRFLWWAFAMLAILAVGLPAYWMREPFRHAGAGYDRGTAYFQDEAISRGQDLFEAAPGSRVGHDRQAHFACENCHGKKGVGGVASYSVGDPLNPDAPVRQVQWAAPPLNTVLLRFRPEEVTTIITYGRPQTPMPPWGVAGGGPMNDQQISDLIAYLTSIQLKPDAVKAANLAQYATNGHVLFDAFCARCHTQGYSYGEPGVEGGGAYGPDLTGGSTLRQFPLPSTQVDWVTNTAPFGKAYGTRGISKGVMPHFSDMLTADQIQAIVDYERSL